MDGSEKEKRLLGEMKWSEAIHNYRQILDAGINLPFQDVTDYRKSLEMLKYQAMGFATIEKHAEAVKLFE